MSAASSKAEAAWGVGMPAWVQALATACDASSQSKVAKQLRYSPAAISNVLANKYKAPTTGIQKAVEGALMGSTVMCPVLGEISTADCQHHSRQPFLATNSMRVQLYRTCPTCPNNKR